MPVTLLVALAGVLAAIVAFYRWASGPGVNRLDSPAQLPPMLAALLNQGVEGARVEIVDRDAPRRRFVFRKYVRAQNDVGICGVYAAPDDDAQSTGRLCAELRSRGIQFTAISRSDGSDELRFDFGHDRGLAQMVLRLLFEQVLNVRIEGSCDAYLYDILLEPAPNLTRVDGPVI